MLEDVDLSTILLFTANLDTWPTCLNVKEFRSAKLISTIDFTTPFTFIFRSIQHPKHLLILLMFIFCTISQQKFSPQMLSLVYNGKVSIIKQQKRSVFRIP